MTIWPDMNPIPEGYYAIPDPDDSTTMTYWRRAITPKTNGLKAWPAKAWFGPAIPLRADAPEDRAERDRFVAAWSESRRVYMTKIIDAILAELDDARRRFSTFSIRCWSCGRALRDETSKTYGIGPECRAGMDPAVLARFCTPAVGRAHVAQLATTEDGPR
ncbi:DUF6011 domain-containing protein [Streptomyces sp. H27-H5]|uniref:DUF6011 domain-containing protein n=1 Tax=Streptomyces sp. H27-H5 TaxID=2996460 RepID=UPI00226F216C|nr:DUF6011 domain-containing protein [Streptomyces sp. H27-H5]MCY0957670.1 DUF6011 domain-containing protein [Streptomyces sp. H27-H5]